MAKGRGGRPKKAEGEKGTRHVRVFEDIADMIGWIYYFRERAGERVSVAQIVDPLLRAQVTALYAPYRGEVEKIKAAEQRALEAGQQAGKKPPAAGKAGS